MESFLESPRAWVWRGVRLLGAVLLTTVGVVAGPFEPDDEPRDASTPAGPPVMRSLDLLGAWSPKADLDTREGTAFSQQHYRAEYRTFFPLSKDWFFRGGAGWGAFYYDFEGPARYPDALHRLNADIGFGRRFGEKWTAFVSVSPGVYSDFEEVTWDDVMAFGILGVQWAVSDSLELYAGARVNPVDKYPVLPLAGLKWDIGDSWRIDAMYPRPSIVWKPVAAVDVFVGMEIRGANYRTGENFDARTPDGRALSNRWLAYSELSAVGGFSVRVSKAVQVETSAGYTFRRKFDYDEVNFSEETEEGAFLGQLALKIGF